MSDVFMFTAFAAYLYLLFFRFDLLPKAMIYAYIATLIIVIVSGILESWKDLLVLLGEFVGAGIFALFINYLIVFFVSKKILEPNQQQNKEASGDSSVGAWILGGIVAFFIFVGVLPQSDNKPTGPSQTSYKGRDELQSSAQEQKSWAPKSINIKNDCNETIVAAITYLGMRDWLSQGWWKIMPGTHINTGVKTTSETIYIYAKSANHKWEGDEKSGRSRVISDNVFTSGGGVIVPPSILIYNVSFKPVLVKSGENIYEITLSCQNGSAN